MRRLALLLAGLVIGGAVSWQVAVAQDEAPLVTLCVRTGADVRTPSSNGRCPSGYDTLAVPRPEEVFVHDEGETLSLGLQLRIPTPLSQVVFTPFAVSPDGTRYFGPTQAGTATSPVSLFIGEVQDPVFGMWHVGFQMAGNSGGLLLANRPSGTAVVRSSREGTENFLAIPPVEPTNDNSDASQTMAPYAYSIPVFPVAPD